LEHLYGPHGPDGSEQTEEYAAPEVKLAAGWRPDNLQHSQRYDMWSAGITTLELLALGTPKVPNTPNPKPYKRFERFKP